MSLKNKKLLLAGLVVLVSSLTPFFVSADGGYLCTPSQGDASTTDAFRCLINIRNASYVVAAIAAVIMISVAGYLYVFAAGNEGNISKAKGLIYSAVSGLVIMLIGGLILQQINPDLLNFRSISPQQIAGREWVLPDGTIVTSNNQPAGSTAYNPALDASQCAGGIKDVPADIAGRTGEKACQSLIDALSNLKSKATALGVNFILTDAYGKGHQSRCHRLYGTCADLVAVPASADGWNKLCTAVKQTGQFRILNEYSRGGAPECGPFVKTALTSGDHIHIVLQGTLDDYGSNASSSTINAPATWPTGTVQGNGVTCDGGRATRGSENTRCTEYSTEIKNAAASTGLSAATIRSLIHIESGFNSGAASGKGAIGLMQITPATATQYGCAANWNTSTQENINCGSKIFKALITKYGGNVPSAIAEYNGGAGSNSASRDCPGLAMWQCAFDNPQKTTCNTGYLETRNYALNYNTLSGKYQSACPN